VCSYLDLLPSSITLNNANTLILDDQNNQVSESWTITGSVISRGSQTVNYDATDVTINGGGGGNTFAVQPAAFDGTGRSVISLPSMLTINGGNGRNSMSVDARDYHSLIRGLSFGLSSTVVSLDSYNTWQINYSQMAALDLFGSSVGGSCDILSTAAGTTSTIHSIDGEDIFTVGNASDILGPVVINGQGGNSTLGREPGFHEFPIPTPNSGAQAVAAAPDGVWFTEFNTNKIARITSNGAITEYAGPSDIPPSLPGMPVGPFDLVSGPDGYLYFLELRVGRIFQFSRAAGTVTREYSLNVPNALLYNLVAGPGQSLSFTVTDATNFINYIGRVDPASGVISLYAVHNNWSASPLAAGPDGNLWFATGPDTGPTYISKITPQGIETDFQLPPPPRGAGPWQIDSLTAGPGGYLWATACVERHFRGNVFNQGFILQIDTAGHLVHQFDLGGELANSTTPGQIIAGPDGNLWFTDSHTQLDPEEPLYGQVTNRIGVMTPSGVFLELVPPTELPSALTGGPDGNIWFTEQVSNRIGAIVLQPALWQITGADSGTLYNNITFNAIPNLVGGLGADTFAFTTSTARISGTITRDGPGNAQLPPIPRAHPDCHDRPRQRARFPRNRQQHRRRLQQHRCDPRRDRVVPGHRRPRRHQPSHLDHYLHDRDPPGPGPVSHHVDLRRHRQPGDRHRQRRQHR
jgi:virginiamycin B lyase